MSTDLFQAIHSPIGANAGFAMGLAGFGGGFCLQSDRIPDQDIFIGYKEGNTLSMLPFYEKSISSEKDSFAKDENGSELQEHAFTEEEVSRGFGLATDTFQAGRLSFSLMNRVTELSDVERGEEPEVKSKALPAIAARFCVDNRDGEQEIQGFFGIGNMKGKQFLSQMYGEERCGVISKDGYGFEAVAAGAAGLREIADFDMFRVFERKQPVRLMLASMGGILFRVPAGGRAEIDLALGWYLGGTVTQGLHSCSYLYTEYYRDLPEVMAEALADRENLWREAEENEHYLEETGLSSMRKKLLCQSVKSFYISSMLMKEGERIRWIVNEGTFLMMNTFDLLIDHLFFECRYHPWTVRNALDFFVESYSYKDQCGISFTHDMGSYYVFTPKGQSSYEIPYLTDCFSYMTQEQLCNWILAAAVYAHRTGDTAWLLSRKETLVECFQSMQKRDGLIPDGIMDVDSSRCEGGSEITTYDSLDVSLGQARRNSYIAMKCFASYLALGSVFEQLSMEEYQEQADSAADNCEEHMLAYFDREKKRFPALFDGEGTMAIVPVIEGIIYPVFFGKSEAVSEDGKHGRLIRALKEHIQTVLVPGICLFEDGGFKLSETSDNSWISKIFLCQYIIEKVLHMNMPQIMDRADAAHWSWWTEGCISDPGIDQIFAGKQTERGFHYPRCVTSILWMEE